MPHQIVYAGRSLFEFRGYLVFAAEFGSGGWNDFISGHETLEAAQQTALYMVQGHGATLWAQVVDVRTLKVVTSYRRFVGRED